MQTLTLAFILCPDMLATSHTFAAEMFQTAQAFARANQRQRAPGLKLHYTGPEAVRTQSGVVIAPDCSFSAIPEPSIVFLPSLFRNPRRAIQALPELREQLRQWHASGSLLIATGTGSVFLAEAGLLDSRAATTHWHYLDHFARQYPSIDLKRDYFITQAGRIYCAASLNALADLTIHLISLFYGLPAANHVERHFSHEIRKPYAHRRYLQGDPNQHTDETILAVQLWLQEHLDRPVLLSEAAEQAGLSVRTFTRRFSKATGLTFTAYMNREKYAHALSLLQETDLSISEVGLAVGMADKAQFSRWFRKQAGAPPSEVRLSLRRKVFSGSGFRSSA